MPSFSDDDWEELERMTRVTSSSSSGDNWGMDFSSQSFKKKPNAQIGLQPKTKSLESLTVEDVCKVLAALNLGNYKNSFIENNVDGKTLGI